MDNKCLDEKMVFGVSILKKKKKTTNEQEIVTVFNHDIFIENKKNKTKPRYSKNNSQRI